MTTQQPKQDNGQREGKLGRFSRRDFIVSAATAATITGGSATVVTISTTPVAAQEEAEETVWIEGGRVTQLDLANEGTSFEIEWGDMVRGGIIDMDLSIQFGNTGALDEDLLDEAGLNEEDVGYERIGWMSHQVDSPEGSLEVKPGDFTDDGNSIDIIEEHPFLQEGSLALDIGNEEYVRDIEIDIRFRAVAREEDEFSSNDEILANLDDIGDDPTGDDERLSKDDQELAVEAELGFGMAFGQAFGVARGPD